MTRCRGAVGREIPSRTEATCDASTEPSVAVTGNNPGSRPPAARVGPAIMPIARGGGASLRMASSPMLCGAIATLPLSERSGSLATRTSNATTASPGLSIGLTSLLVADQFQEPAPGLKRSAGWPSAANTTFSCRPSRASIAACKVSTSGSPFWPARPAAAMRRQPSATIRPQRLMSPSPGAEAPESLRRVYLFANCEVGVKEGAALPTLARVPPDRQGRVAAQVRQGPPRPQPGRPRTRTDPLTPEPEVRIHLPPADSLS